MKKRVVLFASIVVLLALVGGIVFYILDAYEVTDKNQAMANKESVVIYINDWGYFYDGPGSENALIFYPGGKVQDIP